MNITKKKLSPYILFIMLFFLDFLALFYSLKLSFFIGESFSSNVLILSKVQEIEKYYWMIAISLFVFLYEKIYFIRYDFWGETKRVLKGLFISFLIVFVMLTFTDMSEEYSKMSIVVFFLIGSFVVPLFKRIFKRLFFQLDIFKIRVKVVAKATQLEVINLEMAENWYFGFKNTENNYTMVIISSKNFELEELQNLIEKYTRKTKDIYVIPYIDYLDFSHTNIIDYSNIRLSAIHIENRLLNYKNIFIKYFFEKILIVFIFPFVLLIHIFIALLVRIDSSGSIIFKQKRLGKNKKYFSCYKYRTMYENSQDLLDKYLDENPDEVEYYEMYHKYKNDPRITNIGRILRATSLDEFPQFYNILRGDMNLIGPRPYMVSEKERLGMFNEDNILKVKPGITGLWQVSGRNELTFKQRIELDVWYIQNWSLWMDFVIFLKTIKVVLLKVGAR